MSRKSEAALTIIIKVTEKDPIDRTSIIINLQTPKEKRTSIAE